MSIGTYSASDGRRDDPDAEPVDALRRHDERAFPLLVRRYSPPHVDGCALVQSG
jgi:hypothetical protein